MTYQNQPVHGLSTSQAIALQKKYGKNLLPEGKGGKFYTKILHILCEPMFLLLLGAAFIYFLLGEPRDGSIMLVFVMGIISIDIFQEWKTDRTLKALKDLSSPYITVLRDGLEQDISSTELVPGDLMLIHEGIKIPADGFILHCSDLCVDESSLTGEFEGVWKSSSKPTKPASGYWRIDYCYAGTLVTQGSASILVDKTGASTEYGKIGLNIASARNQSTPLQKQAGNLVLSCTFIAAILFLLVGLFTYFNTQTQSFHNRLIESILSGITLAMAMIPEEFPVILTVFFSMGAWRLAKKHSLVRSLPAVETLGAVSVLCVDKTGTITLNQMSVQETWVCDYEAAKLYEIMGLACETDAYDPMEKAILAYCENMGYPSDTLFSGELIREYAFTGQLKMMGHVWKRENEIIIAAKGSTEQIIKLCSLTQAEQETVQKKALELSNKGLRVIAVASGIPSEKAILPDRLVDCRLQLCGLVGLSDPPRETVSTGIADCKKAGIRVVMITGDNGNTASVIAKMIGMSNIGDTITGEMLAQMTDNELCEAVKRNNIFSRVIPEDKMKIIKALKRNGEIVAMTGDGVNDAPALKYADIGIAMGKKGSEVSREAADLILLDDNFATIIETIRDGRRIYDNIRKAVGYIFTIHIPIAFTALLSPLLGIQTDALMLLPLHIVLLELIIDPTCSIVLERQPEERDIMERAPRKPSERLLQPGILLKSILQGLVIFAASFAAYFQTLKIDPDNTAAARGMGLGIIMAANLFLVIVNSSDHDSAFRTTLLLAKDKIMWLVFLATISGFLLLIYTPLNTFFKLAPLTLLQLISTFAVAALSVFWYEAVKLINRKHKSPNISKKYSKY